MREFESKVLTNSREHKITKYRLNGAEVYEIEYKQIGVTKFARRVGKSKIIQLHR